jgi:hypothetical protein
VVEQIKHGAETAPLQFAFHCNNNKKKDMDANNIMLIGLASGAVLVAEATGNEGNSMQLTVPLALVQVADEKTDRTRHALVPYAPAAQDGQILLSATAIEYLGVPLQALKDQYEAIVRQRETGIVTPNKSIITAV